MSDTPNDGGPAFPFKCQGPTTAPEFYYGMTLRDWFAGQALATYTQSDLYYGTAGTPRNPWNGVAVECYRLADAMLAERGRK